MRVLRRLSALADRWWAAGLFLAAFTALLTLPMWLNGFLTGHDHTFHLKWVHHFSAQLWNGEVYPRWLTGMNAGQGSPVFFFYGPLEYWITAALPPWTGQTLEETARQLGLSATLAVLASAVTFFAWARRHVGNAPALTAAVIYLILPYHVAIDVYTRFAFAEFWCFAWLPLALLFADRIVRGERYGIAGFASSYALLLMTHLPSTLMFSAVPAAYLAVFAPAAARMRTLLFGAGAYLLGVMLAAVYVLPAMTMQHYVGMPDVLWAGKYDAWNNFLFYGPRFHGDPKDAAFWRLLTHVTLLTGGVGLLAGALAWKTNRRSILFFSGVLLLAIFMTHPSSSAVWRIASVLHAVQFPWRFNLVATFAAAALCAFGLKAAFDRGSWMRTAAVACIAVALLVPWAHQARDMLRHLRHPFHPDPRLVMNHVDPDEYRPIAVPLPQWAKLRQAPLETATAPLIVAREGKGDVALLSQRPRDIVAHVSATGAVAAVIRQFSFAAWRADLDGRHAPIEATPEGWLAVRVPAGEHELRLQLIALPPERIGRWLSAAGLVALLAGLLVPHCRVRVARDG